MYFSGALFLFLVEFLSASHFCLFGFFALIWVGLVFLGFVMKATIGQGVSVKKHSFFITRLLARAVVVFLVFIVLVQVWFLLRVVNLKFNNPYSTRFMDLRLAQLRINNPHAQLQYLWTPYERIANTMKRAVIVAEDSQFLVHSGVDWSAIESAWQRNERRGRVTHGGSTITQQLAKNLFLNGSRSYVRKAQELVLAWMLEAVLSKRRILEIYLNVVEFGNGVYGVESAARYYYGHSASRLTASQAARLAATLPAPRFYDTHRQSERLAKHAAVVLARMSQAQALP